MNKQYKLKCVFNKVTILHTLKILHLVVKYNFNESINLVLTTTKKNVMK